MKTTVLRYGLLGAATICVLFLLAWFLGSGFSYAIQEVIGYTSMVLSLSFVFFGIKHLRDRVNGGTVSFGKALLTGVLISLFTAVAFGAVDVIYVEYINPGFYDEYYSRMAEGYRNSLSGAELGEKLAALERQKALFGSAFATFALMSVTVLLIGFIISLLSALVLQRKTGR